MIQSMSMQTQASVDEIIVNVNDDVNNNWEILDIIG